MLPGSVQSTGMMTHNHDVPASGGGAVQVSRSQSIPSEPRVVKLLKDDQRGLGISITVSAERMSYCNSF